MRSEFHLHCSLDQAQRNRNRPARQTPDGGRPRYPADHTAGPGAFGLSA